MEVAEIINELIQNKHIFKSEIGDVFRFILWTFLINFSSANSITHQHRLIVYRQNYSHRQTIRRAHFDDVSVKVCIAYQCKAGYCYAFVSDADMGSF